MSHDDCYHRSDFEKMPNDKDAHEMRKTDRRSMVASVVLEIIPEDSSDMPALLHGYTENISIGGICVVLNEKYVEIIHHFEAQPNPELWVCFSKRPMTLKVAGILIWSRNVLTEIGNKLKLGIQFKGLTPKMNAMLVSFIDIR